MTPKTLATRRIRVLGRIALLATGLATAGFVLTQGSSAAEQARVLPPPAMDEAAGQAGPEVAIFAGGCFWGVQGVFQHIQGVTSAVSGYAGGDKATADYQSVSTGSTGHAESVKVTFDPSKISYGQLLQVYFSVAHDPTQLNRQGPDTGTQYRSAVFPTTAEQERVAKAYISQLNQAHAFDTAIATRIEPGRDFYPAEAYHQDFLTLHPNYPYIAVNDMPKVAALQRIFATVYRIEPVLVTKPASAS